MLVKVPILTKSSISSSFVRSVCAKAMSRKVSLQTLLYISFLFVTTIILNVRHVNSFSDHCPELINLDIDEIENHLSKLNLTDVPTIKMMAAGFKCPISALPFGTLKSDWSRLLLLQEAQPDGSIIKHKLIRLIRILIIAYYQMEESFEVTTSDVLTPKNPLIIKTTTITAAKDTNKPDSLNNNYFLTTETLNNKVDHNDSYMNLSSITPLPNKNVYSKINDFPNITETKIVATKSSSRSIGTTNIVPVTENVSSKVLSNCLKQSLKDFMRKNPRHTYNTIFVSLKNKAKHTERATRQDNKINDYWKNRTISKITPTTNEFWKYVTFPTKAPLNMSTIRRAYRLQRLNGFSASPRKMQKRLNTDIYESFRRFYDADKNENAKKFTSNSSDILIERAGKK